MDRTTHRRRLGWAPNRLLGLTALALVVSMGSGCRMLMTTVAYLVQGTMIDADYEGLKNKKVVVVCRPAADLTYSNPTIAEDLARQISTLLRANLPKKTQVVDAQKVNEWTDEHQWMDYIEVGKAMKADVVVGIDLLDFSIYDGQTLYKGKANVNITVYDCKDGKELYQKHMPQTLFPPNSAVPTSDRPEPQFRREFVRELADQIGRHFYPHDKQRDFAHDTDSM